MVYPIKKILVIDDDRSLHDLCRAILTRYDYICISAFNGEEGLEKIRDENPDLILLDWVMPGMNGLQVFEKILEDESFLPFREIPVIMLSAVPKDEEQKNDLLNKGISAYLNKPFGLNELVNVIQNVLITNEVKLKNVKLQKEITRAKQYLERIIDHAPLGILAVDKQGNILRTNKFFALMMGIDHPRDLIEQNVLDPYLLNRVEIRDHFKQAVESGKCGSIPAIDIRNLAGRNIRANIQYVPLRDDAGEITDVLSIWEDVTEVEKKAYELSILRQISEAMQSVLDVDILLNLILTSITAGCALGFSRAIIFMINEQAGVLGGRMGVGPISAEAAYHIWGELAKDHSNLEAFLSRFGKKSPNQDDPFNQEIQKLFVSLEDENNILIQTIHHQKSYWIKDYNQLLAQDITLTSEMIDFFQPEEFVTVPLISKNGAVGVVVADNKYSSVPLRDDQVSLLKLLASHAALALENAEAYRKLEVKVQELAETLDVLRTTQDKLVRSEQLATIGKMAAHVAHEIRNPLTAIGGFAKSIKKSPGDSGQVALGVKIIESEVHRLEKILKSVLDFTRIPEPFLRKKQINNVMRDVVALQQPLLNEKIRLHLHLDENLPLFYFDDEQIKQVMVNVLANSIASIPGEGKIEICTFIRDEMMVIEISDTGVGISKENLENIFNPFFTTRSGGTGLGLAVTQRILEEHGGKIEVESKPNEGSTFRLILPLVFEINENKG
ncbi:MAG TPA: response regulator [Bacteroidetes bacterium]|nr:response regulator [Bacteroidota bacterium]